MRYVVVALQVPDDSEADQEELAQWFVEAACDIEEDQVVPLDIEKSALPKGTILI